MTPTLTSAIETLEWGSRQDAQSASLTPEECRAVLESLATAREVFSHYAEREYNSRTDTDGQLQFAAEEALKALAVAPTHRKMEKE
jgi:hypothetical protein